MWSPIFKFPDRGVRHPSWSGLPSEKRGSIRRKKYRNKLINLYVTSETYFVSDCTTCTTYLSVVRAKIWNRSTRTGDVNRHAKHKTHVKSPLVLHVPRPVNWTSSDLSGGLTVRKFPHEHGARRRWRVGGRKNLDVLHRCPFCRRLPQPKKTVRTQRFLRIIYVHKR